MTLISDKEYLAHYGIKGQKWGIRRFQNEDGTLTEAGKRHVKRVGRKLDRVQKRALKVSDSAAKKTAKARKYDARPLLLKTDMGLAVTRNRAVKAGDKAGKRLKRAQARYDKLAKKYSKLGIDGLNADQIARGKEIVDRLRVYEYSYATGRMY